MKSHTGCVQLILVLKSDELLFLEGQTCSEGTCWTGCGSYNLNEKGLENITSPNHVTQKGLLI